MTGPGASPLDQPCSEQGKLPAAKEFKLTERDKNMPEQKRSFMQELDLWSEMQVIEPLCNAEALHDWPTVVERVQTAIRQKVLQSYRNGQAANSRKLAPVATMAVRR